MVHVWGVKSNVTRGVAWDLDHFKIQFHSRDAIALDQRCIRCWNTLRSRAVDLGASSLPQFINAAGVVSMMMSD